MEVERFTGIGRSPRLKGLAGFPFFCNGLATNRLKLTVSRTNRKNCVFMIRLFVCALCIGIIDGRGVGTLLS